MQQGQVPLLLPSVGVQIARPAGVYGKLQAHGPGPRELISPEQALSGTSENVAAWVSPPLAQSMKFNYTHMVSLYNKS